MSLSRKRKEDAAAGGPPGALLAAEGVVPFIRDDEEDEDLSAVDARYAEAAAAAEDAAAAAAAGYAPLLQGQAAEEAAAAAEAAAEGERVVLGACKGDATEVARHLEETGGFAALGAPQRCDSLLSVRSLDGETDGEGGVVDAAAYCSRKHLYFYVCAHCGWSSEPAGVSSTVPAALPLVATQEERDSLSCIIFGDLMQVLQRNAYERERRRQLQQKVKSRAVAALIAAASSPDARGPRGPPLAASTTWRLIDAQGAEAEKERQQRELDIWRYKRSPQWTFAPPRVPLAAIAEGRHLTCSVKETLAAAAAAAEKAEEAAAAAVAAEGDTASVSSFSSVSAAIRRFPAFTEPLHSEQLLVDRGHPDVAPVYSTARVVAAARGLAMRDRAGLQNLLQCPEAYAAAASGIRFLPLKRRCLIPRRSKRCSFCGRFVIKAQLNPSAVPPFKINHAAALYLPHIECCVGGDAGCLLQGQRCIVFITLCSYADTPVTVRLRSSTAEYSEQRRKRQQEQRQQVGDNIEHEEEEEWWNVEWEGALSVDLDPYDELLDEIGGPRRGDPGSLEDKNTLGRGDAVLARWGNGTLLRLEVYVHSNSNDNVGVLPFAAEVSLGGGGGAPPIFRVHYVAFLGTVGRRGGAIGVKRTETI